MKDADKGRKEKARHKVTGLLSVDDEGRRTHLRTSKPRNNNMTTQEAGPHGPPPNA
jgi:hypothetical protein